MIACSIANGVKCSKGLGLAAFPVWTTEPDRFAKFSAALSIP